VPIVLLQRCVQQDLANRCCLLFKHLHACGAGSLLTAVQLLPSVI
jgi:hypothetical protein